MGLPHQKLGVFQLGQALHQLLVFARLGVGLLYLLQGEARAVQFHGIGLVKRLQAIELCLGFLRSGKRRTVLLMRLGNVALAPFVQQRALVRRGKQALMLVLAAQIHALPHRLRKLLQRGQRTVDRGARTTLGGDTAGGHHAVFVGAFQEEAAFHLQFRRALAHQAGFRALADEQLQRVQQRRFARARFARDDGKARCGGKRGLGNQGNVLDMHLVDHGNPLPAETVRAHRAIRFDSTTWF